MGQLQEYNRSAGGPGLNLGSDRRWSASHLESHSCDSSRFEPRATRISDVQHGITTRGLRRLRML
eukprot:2203311-Alexandrium_andersonii.AAC.1